MLEYRSYRLDSIEDNDGDCIKLDHVVTLPDGSQEFLDFTPYDVPTQEDFEAFVKFYEANGYWMDRMDARDGPVYFPLGRGEPRGIYLLSVSEYVF